MATYSVEKLVDNFQFVSLSPDDAVIAKCLELCISYKMSEEELVDLWVAFAISSLKSAPPSVEGLELLERRELSKHKGAVTAQTPERKKPAAKANYNTPSAPKAPSTNKSLNDSQTQEIAADVSILQVDNFADRVTAGKITLSHGSNIQYKTCFAPVHAKLFGSEAHWMPPSIQQMYCHVHKQQECLAGITEYVAKIIAQKNNITLDSFSDRESSDGVYYGTIVCDGDEKLNKTSALLELPGGDYSNGDKVRLNLSQLSSYAMFPGQVAVVRGKFIKGTLQVTELFNDAFAAPAQKLETGGLQMIAASGPFTIKNNLLYEPLQDLLTAVLEARPHVLILSGPFLDQEHESVHTMTESFDAFFATLIESVMAPLDGSNIHVVLVSSHRDVHHFPVFPTPPYALAAKYTNLLCAPDPCVLDIDGLHVGVTTADVLFNIGKEELAYGAGGVDRMSRLSRYLLGQLNFYPLQSPESRVPVDCGLLEMYGLMETPPHVLIVPSNFRHFVKNISGCTVVNPERLVKGYAGGTYARLQVGPARALQISCEIISI